MNTEITDLLIVSHRQPSELIVRFVHKHFIETGELLIPFNADSIPNALSNVLQGLPTFDHEVSTYPSTAEADNLRSKLGQVARAKHGPNAILARSNPQVLDYAILFALGSGRPIITCDDLADGLRTCVQAGMQTVTVFGQLEDLNLKFLHEAWRLSLETGLRVGLIPHRSLEEVQWWLIKRLFSNTIYCDYLGGTILARDVRAASFSDVSFVIAESDFDSNHITRLRTPHQFCLAQFHAKECCAKFNAHVFCGLRIGASPVMEGSESIPGCAESKGCVWPLERIPFNHINAAHFIAISCGSLRLSNRLFHRDLGLGLNIFSGVPRSYLSPMRFVVSNGVLPSVLGDLAMSGVSLGEIANSANNLIRDSSCDQDCFVLLGDPDDKIDVGKALEFELRNLDPSFQFENQSYPVRENLSLAGNDTTQASERCFAVSAIDPLASRSIVQKLPNEILQFAMPAGGPISSSKILRALLKSDHREGLWLSLKYGGAEHRLTTEQVCCLWCKTESVVYSRESTHWQRIVVNCPRCGIIADLPTGNYEKLSLEVPDVLHCGQEFELKSTYIVGKKEERAACGFSLIHCRSFGWSSFEENRPRLIFNDGSVVALMSLTVPLSAYPFAYWIRATWISPEGISWISRPVTISAQRGPLHHQHKCEVTNPLLA